LNKKQAVEYETSRSRRKYDHYARALDKVVAGTRDLDLQQNVIDIVANVKLEDMTDD